ncbi:hypothetical protein QP477_10350 [Haemophilus seminalis]|uniref:hypothetical protein n=1 Tax=Haemophilus seminalis TaxID=2582921 RepID=UPI0025538600|nr:hypothetical protein [Haemophilus seminalis]MDK7281814.1 hypothetical protein [Haemophilus seminalis]
MSNITIQHITPRHFYEAVKLLKQTEHNIRFSYDTVEIRFVFDRLETAEQTQARFEKMAHNRGVAEIGQSFCYFGR